MHCSGLAAPFVLLENRSDPGAREVGELVDAGWIAREGNELRFTALACQQLAQTRLAIERLAVRNYEIVDDLVRRS